MDTRTPGNKPGNKPGNITTAAGGKDQGQGQDDTRTPAWRGQDGGGQEDIQKGFEEEELWKPGRCEGGGEVGEAWRGGGPLQAVFHPQAAARSELLRGANHFHAAGGSLGCKAKS